MSDIINEAKMQIAAGDNYDYEHPDEYIETIEDLLKIIKARDRLLFTSNVLIILLSLLIIILVTMYIL